MGPFAGAGPDRLRRIMEVNFFAPVETIRAALPLLRYGRQPIVVNIGSVLGRCAVPDKSEYCASKFALHGFSDALRAELASEMVDVLLVSPSTTQSEFFDRLLSGPAEQRGIAAAGHDRSRRGPQDGPRDGRGEARDRPVHGRAAAGLAEPAGAQHDQRFGGQVRPLKTVAQAAKTSRASEPVQPRSHLLAGAGADRRPFLV